MLSNGESPVAPSQKRGSTADPQESNPVTKLITVAFVVESLVELLVCSRKKKPKTNARQV